MGQKGSREDGAGHNDRKVNEALRQAGIRRPSRYKSMLLRDMPPDWSGYFFSVNLVQAKGFLISRPYGCIQLPDDQLKVSRSVQKKTSNPVWNSRLDFLCETLPEKIEVSFWDDQLVRGKRCFAETTIPLDKTVLEKEDTIEKWYPLKMVGGEEASVEIRISSSRVYNLDKELMEYTEGIGVLSLKVVGVTGMLGRSEALYTLIDYGLQHFKTRTSSKGGGKAGTRRQISSPSNLQSQANAEAELGESKSAPNLRERELAPVFDHFWNETLRMWINSDMLNHKLMCSVCEEKDSTVKGATLLDLSQFLDGKVHSLSVPLYDLKTGRYRALSDRNRLTLQKVTSEAQNSMDIEPGQPEKPQKGDVVIGYLQVEATMTHKDDVEEGFYLRLLEAFDVNADNHLSEVEFRAALVAMGIPFTDESLTKLFAECDKDKNGTLDKAEIVNILRSPQFQNDFARPPAYTSTALLAFAIEGKEGLDSMIFGIFNRAPNDPHLPSAGDEHLQKEDLLVLDRESGLVLREHIPNYVRIALGTLYRTRIGRSATNTRNVRALLRKLSLAEGRKMDAPESAERIPRFIEQHNINMEEVLLPVHEFKTFNQFFYRSLKPDARPVVAPEEPRIAVCSADCRLVVYASINEATSVWIKGREFTLDGLLGPRKDLVEQFQGAAMAIFRLAPQDYHRWHWPCDGVVGKRTVVPGSLFTVNPIAVREETINVFTENSRVICELESDAFGKVLLIAVGATMVGSINFIEGKSEEGTRVKKGDQHGYFAFGGSTCVVLFQRNKIVFDYDILRNSRKPIETLVKVGTSLGSSPELSRTLSPKSAVTLSPRGVVVGTNLGARGDGERKTVDEGVKGEGMAPATISEEASLK